MVILSYLPQSFCMDSCLPEVDWLMREEDSNDVLAVSTPGGDPRLQSKFVETASVERSQVVLVGVVHDHPASAYRVRRIIEHVSPAVVALEVPSLAIPLFEQYAADGPTPPREGGEMSAAIQAARDCSSHVRVVGIDLPSWHSVRELGSVLVRERPSPRTLWSVICEVSAVVRHTVRCRAAAAGFVGAIEEQLGRVDHDVSVTDPAGVQADHEASHIARSRALLGAIDRPAAMQLTDESRERAMAKELANVASRGDVVAVVGFDHLDSVSEYLQAES